MKTLNKNNKSGKELIEKSENHNLVVDIPDDVIEADTIPLTSTGKIDKKTIRAQLDADGYQLPDLR